MADSNRESVPSARVQWAERAVLIAVFALPFDLILTSVARYKLGDMLGPLAWVVHPALLLMGAALVAGWWRRPIGVEWWVHGSLVVYALGLFGSALATGAHPQHYWPALVGGPLLISVVFAALLREDLRPRIVRAWVAGMIVWSALFLVLYLRYHVGMLAQFPALEEASLDSRVIALRVPGEAADVRQFYFWEYIGNYNKTSNLLLLTMILAAWLYLKRFAASRLCWWAAAVTVGAMLLVTFSRGTLALTGAFGAAVIAIGVLRRWEIREPSTRHFAVGAVSLAVLAFAWSGPGFRAYWLDLSSLKERRLILSHARLADDDREEGALSIASVLGTAQSKIETSPETSTEVSLLWGYGSGRFGPTIGRRPEAETHVAFLDAWVQGGLFGFIGFVSLFSAMAVTGLWNLLRARPRWSLPERTIGTLGVGITIVLCLREFALVYLFVQTGGAFLIAVIASLIFSAMVREPTEV